MTSYKLGTLSRLVIQGYRRALVFTDLWKLNKVDRSDELLPEFEQEWEKRIDETGWE